MESSGIVSLIANVALAVYVCGSDRFHGCSTQIVLKEKVYSRQKYGM